MAVPVIITVPTAKVLITTGAALVGIVASFFLVKNIPMPTPQVVIPTIANDITKGIIEAEKTLGTSAIPEAVQLAQAKAHVEALTKTVSENIAN